jgi:DUF1680 family protein
MLGGLGVAVSPWLAFDHAHATTPSSDTLPGGGGDRMAASAASLYRPYRAKSSDGSAASTWVQIDLGSSRPIDAVKLYPYIRPHFPSGDGFPLRFRIECSDDPAFGTKKIIANSAQADYPDPGDRIVEFKARNAAGRYVRLTTTRLRARLLPEWLALLPEPTSKVYRDLMKGEFHFILSKMEVIAEGVDVALHCPVSVDAGLGNPADAQQLTRSPRPQGEGLVTDIPQNVTSPEGWRAVAYRAQAPVSGVQVKGGLFATALETNVRYLLDSFTVDDLLKQFRQRAGKPVPPSARTPEAFWEEDLAGSNAGRFLMGAGKTLHWIDHTELRSRLNAVVDEIAACRQPNGYIMAYPEDTFFVSERGAYTRAWTTHGLIEAGYAGNTKAFELLRGYYDWYNQRPYLARALRGCNQGGQGMVANSRMYFSPVGKPADVQVLQRYFQENYWLEDLAARRAEAIWQYPYDRAHCYLLTNVEAYLDMYRATGERRYLDAVFGCWELVHENWQSVAGSIELQEQEQCPPKAHPLLERYRGESCGSAFWVLLNQRLHLLDPEAEKYVTEIERSIYNVFLANQAGNDGIRYHTRLVGQKDTPQRVNTCCEGQGTRILASLPEFIYSVTEDGVYVNLFEPSTITWRSGAGDELRIQMSTAFPKAADVRLSVHVAKPTQAKLRVRTPSWATGAMAIQINRAHAATGTPGSYVTLDRLWNEGDEISFVLPIAMKATPYTGVDQLAGRERFSLTYGPILMAAVGAAELELEVPNAASPADLAGRLVPKADAPLHFTAPVMKTEWVPYYEIAAESFSCVPVIAAQPI